MSPLHWDPAHGSGRRGAWSGGLALSRLVSWSRAIAQDLGLNQSPLSMPMTSPAPRSPGQSVAPEA